MKKIFFILIIGSLFAENFTINRLDANTPFWEHSVSSNNIVYNIDFNKNNLKLNLIAGIFPENVEIVHHKGKTSAYICFTNHDIECVTATTYFKTSMKKIIPLDSEMIDKYGRKITRETYGDWLLQPCDNDCVNRILNK